MDSQAMDQETARRLQLLLSTQLAHATTMVTVKAIENQEEIDLASLKPSASRDEFLEIIIFSSFCFGMLGAYRESPARNYLLDSSFLFFGKIIGSIGGKEAIGDFERLRASRLTRYMNLLNNTMGNASSAKRGHLIESLIENFEGETLRRSIPALRPVLLEFFAAQERVSERAPDELRAALQKDLGRNGSFKSMIEFLKSLGLLRKQSDGKQRFEHLGITEQIFDVYLSESDGT